MRSGIDTLVDALVYHWVAFLLVAAGVTLGVALVVQAQPSRFDSSAVVAFAPRPESQAGADVVRVLAPQYVAVATAPSTLDEAAARAGLDADAAAYEVDAALVPDTNTIELTVGDPDAQQAADVASALADLLVQAAADDPLLTASVVSAAVPPDAPAAPARPLYSAAGLLAGLVLGFGVAVALEQLYPRVRGIDGLEAAAGVPVLVRVVGDLGPEPEDLEDPGVGPAVRELRLLLDDEVRVPTHGGARAGHVVALVGAAPQQGTGDLAAAVTHAFAALGRHVLLLSADEQALVHGSGLVRALQGRPLPEVLEPVPSRDPGEALQLQPAAHSAGRHDAADDPLVDLLARGWDAVLGEAARTVDVVVVSGPPAGPSSEALLVTRALPTVLVVREGADTGAVRDGAQALRTSGAHLVGAVLVGAGRRGRGRRSR